MHDIKAIRENPKSFDDNWARRGLAPQTPSILKIDEELRAVQTKLQLLQQSRNEASKKIGQLKSSGGDAESEIKIVAQIKAEMTDLEGKAIDKTQELFDVLSALPNMMDGEIPDGDDEEDNIEISTWGTAGKTGIDHVEIGEKLGLIDFETAAKISGARFVILKGEMAKLERAIGQFMLDLQINEGGYEEISVPLLVNDSSLFGTGQLPKFSEDLFKDTDENWMIPTAAVQLTNLVSEKVTDKGDLPLRFTTLSPCFRSEAGSAGKDTRGMLRHHQFYKVEMVSIVEEDKSKQEHERMLKCAQKVLELLELPYRTVVLCSGDTGFGSQKTYDIEVWLPGQNCYREISSISRCGDFQARRMNARYRAKDEKQTTFLHTLNGSGVAVGRCLIAVIENYWDGEKIIIPEVLKPYMGGITEIG